MQEKNLEKRLENIEKMLKFLIMEKYSKLHPEIKFAEDTDLEKMTSRVREVKGVMLKNGFVYMMPNIDGIIRGEESEEKEAEEVQEPKD